MKSCHKLGGLVSLLPFFIICSPSFAAADALDNWSVRSSGTSATLLSVAYGNGSFVAVGLGGVVLVSTNGQDWVSRNTVRPTDKYCVGFGNGLFLTASSIPFSNYTNALISTDGSNWKGFYLSNSANLWGASYGGGVYFLVGDSSTILTATDFDMSCEGKYTNCNWTLRNSAGNKTFRGAAFGNGTYLVVGDDISLTSTNLVNWSTNFIASTTIMDVAFGNGLFVAVGTVGVGAYVSTNGINWSAHAVGTQPLYRIAFGNGTFVAVGNGVIHTSTDGLNWKKRPSPVTTLLTGVTYGNGSFVATGPGGVILQSASVSTPTLIATRNTNGITLTLDGEIGRSYRVQVATNIASPIWDTFLSFTNSAPRMEFLDTSVTNIPVRFYRGTSP